MLFLSILDVINQIAEEFAEDPGPMVDDAIEIRAENFNRSDLPNLAGSIVNSLEECSLVSIDEASFVLEWNSKIAGFMITVSFDVDRADGTEIATISMDLSDDIPFDF